MLLAAAAKLHIPACKSQLAAAAARLSLLHCITPRPCLRTAHLNPRPALAAAATPADCIQPPCTYPRRPNFYLHCPTRTDPSAAPKGCDSIMVLLPVANMQQMAAAAGADPQDYSALVAAGREAVLAVLAEAGVGDVKGSIQRELLIDPPQWRSRWVWLWAGPGSRAARACATLSTVSGPVLWLAAAVLTLTAESAARCMARYCAWHGMPRALLSGPYGDAPTLLLPSHTCRQHLTYRAYSLLLSAAAPGSTSCPGSQLVHAAHHSNMLPAPCNSWYHTANPHRDSHNHALHAGMLCSTAPPLACPTA